MTIETSEAATSGAAGQNLLLTEVRYKIETTRFGTWKRYLYPSGAAYAEFTSRKTLFGLPLVHYTAGRSPETGRRKVAVGVLAVGRIAVGIVPVGQLAVGLAPIGQAAIGVAALGQGALGIAAVGQLGLGILLGVGQIASGYVAVGQLAVGKYVLAQAGAGAHLWSPAVADPDAVRFFRALKETIFP